MRKRQSGQAFILVLILLAIGALLVVPSLRLAASSLKGSQIVTRNVRSMYAADGAEEYVLWKLKYDGYGSQFTYDGQSENFTVNVCGTPVDITIIMRAVETGGGTCLATDHVIRPTSTVYPDTIPNDTYTTYTYTIRLERLSDNNTQGLDAIYDILPDGFLEEDYISGSSYFRVGGGSWEPLADPLIEEDANRVRLRWPASGNFVSPIRDFDVRQVKELKFQFACELPDDRVFCNWVVLKPWNTISGSQASIIVGSPPDPGGCNEDGLLAVDKVADPEVIQPGVETDVMYTISITNRDGFTQHIEEIRDYLPPGSTYTDNSTSGLTTLNPQLSLEDICGERQLLLWTEDEFLQGGSVPIAGGETLTLTFWARVTQEESGSYYNEVMVIADVPIPKIFEDIGVTQEDYLNNYSWNTGTVLVPYYDSRADADGVIIDANIGLTLGGLYINSWQVK